MAAWLKYLCTLFNDRCHGNYRPPVARDSAAAAPRRRSSAGRRPSRRAWRTGTRCPCSRPRARGWAARHPTRPSCRAARRRRRSGRPRRPTPRARPGPPRYPPRGSVDVQRECHALTTLWSSNAEGTCMRRTAVAGGAIAAHKVVVPAPSALECASNVSMNPEVQLSAPNGSLGHTRGQATCATARWKALANALMPVHFAWNEMPHNSDSTAKAVGSHSVSNTSSSVSSTTMARNRPRARHAARSRCLRGGTS